jgi:hypothetical protein
MRDINPMNGIRSLELFALHMVRGGFTGAIRKNISDD